MLAMLGAVVGAATEPAIPALLQPLLDKGFAANQLPLWTIPAAIIGLFFIRGAAGFVAQYGLASAAQGGVLQLRSAMFERLLAAEPALFTRHSASQLTNTLVYEVQQGTIQLVGALLMGVGGVTALGCTIGQGLSGVSTLALGSFITLAAIVAGAVLALRWQVWRLERDL